MPAQVKILVEGYSNADAIAETGEERTCPTITLVRDGGLVMVVDPGVLPHTNILIDALAKEGLAPKDVNMVCLTHSHIDHYRNIGLFPDAKIIEYFGIWHEDTVEDWKEQFTDYIQILRTPGHDYTCISLFVGTDDGVVAICGDVFWKKDYPEIDMFATDPAKLAESRWMVSKMADWIIPGHGPMYKSSGHGAPIKKKQGFANNSGNEKKKICSRCHKSIKSMQDSCECQPWLCYHCCECEDCELCNCKHRK